MSEQENKEREVIYTVTVYDDGVTSIKPAENSDYKIEEIHSHFIGLGRDLERQNTITMSVTKSLEAAKVFMDNYITSALGKVSKNELGETEEEEQ